MTSPPPLPKLLRASANADNFVGTLPMNTNSNLVRDFYKLEGKKAVPIKTIQEWGIAFDNNRHVADDVVEAPPGDAVGRMARVVEEVCAGTEPPESIVEAVRISTAFLGIDHNFTGRGPPLLFETMVFGGALDGECGRTATWEEAEKEHAETLARVLRMMPPNVKVRSALP